jgi:hypothetical protein
MKSVLTLAMALLIFISSTDETSAQAPRFDRRVGLGQTIVLTNFTEWQNGVGCISGPPNAVSGDPKPKFGTLISETKTVFRDGPCGKREYFYQVISYKAGNIPGVDDFDLFVYSSFGSSPWNYKTKIIVGGASTAAPPATAGTPKQNVISNPVKIDQQQADAKKPLLPSAPTTAHGNVASSLRSSELPTRNRQITVLGGQTVAAGFTWHLNNDCSSAGVINHKMLQIPRHGKVRVIEGEGYSNYDKDDIRFECNRKKSTVTRIYYDAPPQPILDSFAVQVFYPNGNTRKYLISVNVK